MDEKRERTNKYGFVPYATMFKLESHPRLAANGDPEVKKLQCVSCASLLEWKVYTLDPKKFDAECPMCHVKADDFWKEKPYRKVNDG